MDLAVSGYGLGIPIKQNIATGKISRAHSLFVYIFLSQGLYLEGTFPGWWTLLTCASLKRPTMCASISAMLYFVCYIVHFLLE